MCANLRFVENTTFSPKTGFCDLCQKIGLCFRYCNYVSRSVSLDYGDITKYNISISFDWQWLFWSAEGLNARPVHSKLDRFPRFQTKETPEKRSSKWAVCELQSTEMNSPTTSSRKPYANCCKHSAHRRVRARRNSAIFEFRAIWKVCFEKLWFRQYWLVSCAKVGK